MLGQNRLRCLSQQIKTWFKTREQHKQKRRSNDRRFFQSLTIKHHNHLDFFPANAMHLASCAPNQT